MCVTFQVKWQLKSQRLQPQIKEVGIGVACLPSRALLLTVSIGYKMCLQDVGFPVQNSPKKLELF